MVLQWPEYQCQRHLSWERYTGIPSDDLPSIYIHNIPFYLTMIDIERKDPIFLLQGVEKHFISFSF